MDIDRLINALIEFTLLITASSSAGCAIVAFLSAKDKLYKAATAYGLVSTSCAVLSLTIAVLMK